MSEKTVQMFHIVLFEPLIPGNTGNIIRLCANTGASLHLIRPLGFNFDEAHLRRASLDYSDLASITEYESLESYILEWSERRVLAITTSATETYTDTEFTASDSLLFGREDTGLPDLYLEGLPTNQKLLIPMQPSNRSINLSNSVAIVTYEAWRQLSFQGRI